MSGETFHIEPPTYDPVVFDREGISARLKNFFKWLLGYSISLPELLQSMAVETETDSNFKRILV